MKKQRKLKSFRKGLVKKKLLCKDNKIRSYWVNPKRLKEKREYDKHIRAWKVKVPEVPKVKVPEEYAKQIVISGNVWDKDRSSIDIIDKTYYLPIDIDDNKIRNLIAKWLEDNEYSFIKGWEKIKGVGKGKAKKRSKKFMEKMALYISITKKVVPKEKILSWEDFEDKVQSGDFL